MRKLTKEQRDEFKADHYRYIDAGWYCPQDFIDALDDLDQADREIEVLNARQWRKASFKNWKRISVVAGIGRRWKRELEAKLAESEANAKLWYDENLDACRKWDDLRAKLAEAERQLEITQDGLMDVQKRLIDREDKLAEAEARELNLVALADARSFAYDQLIADLRAKLADAQAEDREWKVLMGELVALREVERAARPIKLTLCASAASAYIHELHKAIAAVDALRKST